MYIISGGGSCENAHRRRKKTVDKNAKDKSQYPCEITLDPKEERYGDLTDLVI